MEAGLLQKLALLEASLATSATALNVKLSVLDRLDRLGPASDASGIACSLRRSSSACPACRTVSWRAFSCISASLRRSSLMLLSSLCRISLA